VSLPDRYNMASKRIVEIERKMKRDDNFAQAYNSIWRTTSIRVMHDA